MNDLFLVSRQPCRAVTHRETEAESSSLGRGRSGHKRQRQGAHPRLTRYSEGQLQEACCSRASFWGPGAPAAEPRPTHRRKAGTWGAGEGGGRAWTARRLPDAAAAESARSSGPSRQQHVSNRSVAGPARARQPPSHRLLSQRGLAARHPGLRLVLPTPGAGWGACATSCLLRLASARLFRDTPS